MLKNYGCGNINNQFVIGVVSRYIKRPVTSTIPPPRLCYYLIPFCLYVVELSCIMKKSVARSSNAQEEYPRKNIHEKILRVFELEESIDGAEVLAVDEKNVVDRFVKLV
uniref:Uncharacterized protein n=1 Tax=Romanomermis culicivorax TaxID=13658 RepID=A0A915J3H5_ROMCU